ncbi:MAG: helix-turn-helix domain-containing protein [Actinomycetota bacterium]|nr:helix-turn-helix domain-containing protein [Actinomycetota bacterium]
MGLDQLPATLSVEEAGELLGISRRSAYRAAARGELPTVRLGRRLVVPTPKLLAMLGLEEPSDNGRRTGESTA